MTSHDTIFGPHRGNTELQREFTEILRRREKPPVPAMAPTVGQHSRPGDGQVLALSAGKIAELRTGGAFG